MKTRHLIRTIAFLVVCTVLIVSQIFWDVPSQFNPETIQQWLNRAGALAPLFYMAMMALAVVVSPIPSVPLDVASGAFFGPLEGTLYSVAGALAGAIISFMISRLLGRQFVERFLGGHINFCTTCTDKVLTKIVFVSRLLPVVSFDIVSYGAGLTKMSLKRFSLATSLGMIPLTFAYNFFGSVLVFGKGFTVLLGLTAVVVFFLYPRWVEQKGYLRGTDHGS